MGLRRSHVRRVVWDCSWGWPAQQQYAFEGLVVDVNEVTASINIADNELHNDQLFGNLIHTLLTPISISHLCGSAGEIPMSRCQSSGCPVPTAPPSRTRQGKLPGGMICCCDKCSIARRSHHFPSSLYSDAPVSSTVLQLPTTYQGAGRALVRKQSLGLRLDLIPAPPSRQRGS